MKSISRKSIWLQWVLVVALLSQTANAGMVGDAYFALNSSLLSNLLAKEMCSCIYVTGADQRFGAQNALKRCLLRGNLPLPLGVMNLVVKKGIQVKNDSVRVDPTLLSKVVTVGHDKTGFAVYDRTHPEYGCSLQFK